MIYPDLVEAVSWADIELYRCIVPAWESNRRLDDIGRATLRLYMLLADADENTREKFIKELPSGDGREAWNDLQRITGALHAHFHRPNNEGEKGREWEEWRRELAWGVRKVFEKHKFPVNAAATFKRGGLYVPVIGLCLIEMGFPARQVERAG